MAEEVVGAAWVQIHAMTAQMKKDIRDGLSSADKEVEKSGQQTGKVLSKGIADSVRKDVSLEHAFHHIGANAVEGLFEEFDRIKTRLAAVSAKMSDIFSVKRLGIAALIPAITSGISAIGAGLASLIGTLGKATSSLLALTGIFGSLIQTLIVGKLAFGGFAKAVGGDAEALAKLSSSAQGAVLAFRSLKDASTGLRQAIQEAVFFKVDNEIKGLRKTLTAIQPDLQGTGTKINIIFRNLLKWAQSTKTIQKMQLAIRGNNEVIDNLGKAAIPVLSGILGLYNALLPSAEKLSERIEGVTKRFDKWANSAKTAESIGAFMDRAAQSMGIVWDTVKNISAGLRNLFGVASEGDKAFLWLERITRQFREWTESVEGQNAIRAWVNGGLQSLAELGKAIHNLQPLIKALFNPKTIGAMLAILQPVVAAMGAFVELVASFPTPVLYAIGAAFVSWKVYAIVTKATVALEAFTAASIAANAASSGMGVAVGPKGAAGAAGKLSAALSKAAIPLAIGTTGIGVMADSTNRATKAAGGLQGALGGAALGGSIGSLIPVVGTLTGAALGGLTGLALGLATSGDKAAEAAPKFDDLTNSVAPLRDQLNLTIPALATLGDISPEVATQLQASRAEFDEMTSALEILGRVSPETAEGMRKLADRAIYDAIRDGKVTVEELKEVIRKLNEEIARAKKPVQFGSNKPDPRVTGGPLQTAVGNAVKNNSLPRPPDVKNLTAPFISPTTTKIIQDAGRAATRSYNTGVQAASPSTAISSKRVAAEAQKGLELLLPGFATSGTRSGTTYGTGINGTKTKTSKQAKQVAASAQTAMGTMSRLFGTTGTGSGTSYSTGLSGTSRKSATAGKNLGTAAKGGIDAQKGGMEAAGGSLGSALARGLENARGTIESVASSIASAIQGFFGGSPVEHGPLLSFNKGRIGENLVQMGLIDGMNSKKADVRRSANQLASALRSSDMAGLGVSSSGSGITLNARTSGPGATGGIVDNRQIKLEQNFYGPTTSAGRMREIDLALRFHVQGPTTTAGAA